MRYLPFALAALSFLPAAAHADTFTIAVTVNGSTNTGTVSGDSIGSGAYRITSVSGSGLVGFPGSNPVTVVDPSASLFGADNLFFPNDTRLFDVSGLELSGIFGTANLFLFNGGPGFSVQGFDSVGDFYDLPASVRLVTSAATPEPSGILLSFTGMLAIAGFCFRKRFSQLAADPEVQSLS